MAKPIASIHASIVCSSITSIINRVSKEFDREQMSVLRVVTELPKRIYVVTDPSLIREFFSHEQVSITKPHGLMPREDYLMQGALIADQGKTWKRKRSPMSKPFQPKNHGEFFTHVQPAVSRFLERVERHASSGDAFDICWEVRRCTIDMSLQMFFSEHLTDAELDAESENIVYLENVMPEQVPLWIPTPGNLSFKRGSARLRGFCQSLIAKRRLSGTDRGDYLDYLLAIDDPELGRPWNDEEIIDQMLAVFLGASAISTPLFWTSYLLASQPETARRVRDEFEAIGTDGKAPTFDQAKELTYFEWVIKESMRLYPTFWGNIRFAENGCDIGDYHFPKGSIFLLLRYFANRHPQFWENPQAFDPERFDPKNENRVSGKHYIPFGAGPRTCLGVHMSVPIVKMILGPLLSRFDIADPRTTPNGQPQIDFSYGLYPKAPIVLKATQRKASETSAPQTSPVVAIPSQCPFHAQAQT